MLLNTHRHYNTAVALVLDCFNHSGAQRILELEDDLLLLDGRDRVQDVAGVEADAELLARVLDLERLLRLAKLLARGGQPERRRREGELDRLVPPPGPHRGRPGALGGRPPGR